MVPGLIRHRLFVVLIGAVYPVIAVPIMKKRVVLEWKLSRFPKKIMVFNWSRLKVVPGGRPNHQTTHSA